MTVSRSTTERFAMRAGVAALLVGSLPVLAACSGGGDAPSFTTTQSTETTSPSADRPDTPNAPDKDDSEIGNGNGDK